MRYSCRTCSANANYLSAQELLVDYRLATNVTERTHYQIIWLLVTRKTPLEVAHVTGYSRTWIYQLVKRYNKWGTKSLGDERRHNQGQEAILTDLQQAQLWQVLCEQSPDCGLWNGRKLADWLSELTGKR